MQAGYDLQHAQYLVREGDSTSSYLLSKAGFVFVLILELFKRDLLGVCLHLLSILFASLLLQLMQPSMQLQTEPQTVMLCSHGIEAED